MNIKVLIQRFNPETDLEPYMQEYQVKAHSTDRVLDILVKIKREVDDTLTFRYSCSHGICGSDAVLLQGTKGSYIDAKEGLVCKLLVQAVIENEGDTLTIKPLRHLPIQRDLIVDQTRFYDNFKRVKPYLLPKETDHEREMIQSIKERDLFDDATKCIMCGSCYSACPVLDNNPDFIGPQAIIAAMRFVEDSRDQGLAPRLDILDRAMDGVWACENKFDCTKACPRDIKVTKLINKAKIKIKAYRKEMNQETHEIKKAK